MEWKTEGEVVVVENGSAGAANGIEVGARQQIMPGVLMDPQDDLRPPKPSKRRLAEDMADQPTKKVKREASANGVRAANGDHGLPNGVQINGASSAVPKMQDQTVAGIESLIAGQLPPELEHVTGSWLSISTLITRLAQETFIELGEKIDELVEIEAALGNEGNIVEDTQCSLQKKQLMLGFTHDRRAQFIKMLVLSQWCRRADELEKAVDLHYWLHVHGKVPVEKCTEWMREMTKFGNKTKMSNPDLKTALEALSLGKASWLTDVRPLISSVVSALTSLA